MSGASLKASLPRFVAVKIGKYLRMILLSCGRKAGIIGGYKDSWQRELDGSYSCLLPRRSRPARFYILPKIHKNKQNRPGHPIVSANSHPTENISQFVDSHLNPLVPKLPSYIKDTTHFLKKLDDLKELPPLDPF